MPRELEAVKQAARELMRVCRPGGKIGMANWTPESFIGRLFKTVGKYIPPAPGVKSPALWGNQTHLESLFGAKADIAAERKNVVFRYKSLDQWLEAEDLHPRIAGEVDDSALMTAFGQAGTAAFPAPTVIEPEIVRQYKVQVVGRVKSVRERYYAISAERRLKHPGVVAITNSARTDLFG